MFETVLLWVFHYLNCKLLICNVHTSSVMTLPEFLLLSGTELVQTAILQREQGPHHVYQCFDSVLFLFMGRK